VKTLNIKRITALAAGAALLGLGLAFAGPISFQGVPIINSAGQPVVQIVVGSTAQPSDGVAAGNIAAAIGNLAYTTVPVTASVNATQAKSVLKVSVPSASYTIANPQVWLNISSSHAISGAYQFQALIGSVLNRGVLEGQPSSTKTLQTGSSNYAYPNNGAGTYSLNTFPMSSPYTDAMYSQVPLSTEPVATNNGGGITFTSFTTGNGDNIMRITNSELPTLLNNAGQYKESEYLWLTGFPVFNQSKTPGSLMLESADGAYQAYFSTPIPEYTNSNTVNKATISLLGENWTILSYNTVNVGSVTSTTASAGGKLSLAASLTPLETVYVGHNITSGPFTVELTDLGQPNSTGASPAALNIYYNGKLTNVTQIWPGYTSKFNVTGHNLYVNVNNTFAGLYAYQKWAKIQLYSDVVNLTSGQTFNKTNDPNWKVILEWTNSTTGTKPNALSSIIIYGTQAQAMNMQQGQSFEFITDPAAYKFTYVGPTLGAGSFDPVTFTTSTVTSDSEYYANYQGKNTTVNELSYNSILGNFQTTNTMLYVNDTAINETAQLLTVKSSIPNAFSGSFGKTSTLVYDLTPYYLTEYNQINTLSVNSLEDVNVVITDPYNMINSNTPETIYVDEMPFKFTTVGSQTENTKFFQNVTSIYPSNPIPGLTVSVYTESTANPMNSVLMATLTPENPVIFYSTNNKPYNSTTTAVGPTAVTYSQPNQVNTNWVLNQYTPSGVPGTAYQYFNYTIPEYPVPLSTNYQDTLSFGIVNSTKGIGANPLFILNYSASTTATHGTANNVTYTSSIAGYNGVSATSTTLPVEQGFITERGSQVVGITPSELSFNLAKSVDEMEFAVATATTATNTVTGYQLCPSASLPGIGIGQSLAACGIQNATIAKVTANVTVASNANYTITGIGNIQATPSVPSAAEPVLLKNLPTSPLVVLDSNANPSSDLILIGSGYVNTLSKALQAAQNITITPTSAPIVQAYGGNRILIAGYYANQTTAAANNFIEQLYAQASA